VSSFGPLAYEPSSTPIPKEPVVKKLALLVAVLTIVVTLALCAATASWGTVASWGTLAPSPSAPGHVCPPVC
jgi:hypothetical protein